MKRYLTLATCMMLFIAAQSQVLNELYTIPGSGKHEFFELYNNSVYQTPTSMDQFTMVTYYEGAGSEKGFYVMDMPDIMVQPKGYFVGSSALPFSYQGVTNSTKSNFSWNDLAFMSSHNGYLKCWKVANAIPGAVDGNDFYDEQPVPANFNDFFYRKSGGEGSYSVFIYKNGVLTSAFFAGISSSEVPPFLMTMPALNIQMAGGIQFTIDFSTYATIDAEFSNAEAGTDNGYIRSRDGLCGTWLKASAGVQHTPGETNGPQSSIGGDVTFFATVERGVTALDSSAVVYKIISAAAEALPLIVSIYIDNGTKIGELDPQDGFVASNSISTVGVEYRTHFMPRNASVIVTIATPAGCYDKVVYVSNTAILDLNPVSYLRPTRESADQGIILKRNPVRNELSFTFFAITTNSTDISVYSINGIKMFSTTMKPQKGANSVTLPLESSILGGLYVVEVRSGSGRWVAKFLKN